MTIVNKCIHLLTTRPQIKKSDATEGGNDSMPLGSARPRAPHRRRCILRENDPLALFVIVRVLRLGVPH